MNNLDKLKKDLLSKYDVTIKSTYNERVGATILHLYFYKIDFKLCVSVYDEDMTRSYNYLRCKVTDLIADELYKILN